MKMRKNIELIAILMVLLAACLFTACDGGVMEELWKDELGNGSGNGGDVPTPPPAPVTYRVSFDANGGEGTMASVSVEEGADCTVLASEFTAPAAGSLPTGAVGSTVKYFAGWNTASDGTGTAYTEGDTISAVTADMTLYAIWGYGFRVAQSKWVYFAKGNLQYRASPETWQFADNQYDFIGNAPGNNVTSGRDTQSALIDLFGWGTTGYPDTRTASSDYQTNFMPYSCSSTAVANDKNKYGYGPDYDDNKYGLSVDSKSDWGCNVITNGGNTANIWRTLTKDEWTYLFNFDNNTSSNYRQDANRFAKAKVNGVNGLLIFPDGYNGGTAIGTITGVAMVNTVDAAYPDDDVQSWTAMEQAGCVFLPAAGYRNNLTVGGAGSHGDYWSSTSHVENGSYAHCLNFNLNGALMKSNDRFFGFSVRLVCEE